jgi:hypothetical protein
MNRNELMDLDLKVMDWLIEHPDWTKSQLVRTVVDLAEPMIRTDERERLVEAWDRDQHAVRFNKAHDDLTPQGRVKKWLKETDV